MYRVCPAMSSATSTFGDDFIFEDLVALGPQVIFDSEETLRDKAAEKLAASAIPEFEAALVAASTESAVVSAELPPASEPADDTTGEGEPA